MFKDAVAGLDRILETDIAKGSIIIITGAEGTLKSSLAFSLINRHLYFCKDHGLYSTLEQTKESHLQNMESIGIKRSDRLHIFDYCDMRREWESNEPDMIKFTEDVIHSYLEKHSELSVFALDSVNALYTLSSPANLRRAMYHFFATLRERNLTSLLIVEQSGDSQDCVTNSGPEHFLADGVIELGLVQGAEGVKRYIRIRKMRGCRHRMERHQIIVADGELSILGPIY
jgi:KaiC/GvpD/RAD55 family RecA-like ATPase